jgi:opacity protein-like surface antigen
MLKKLLAVTALMSVVNVAAASAYPYVGVSSGLLINSTESGETSGSAGVFRGIPLNVFLGFANQTPQGLYLAGELTGTLGAAEISNANGLKTTYGYGASIIPGVMLSEHTLAFGRAGIVNSRFSNVSSNSTGGQLGAGLQTSLTQSLDLRGEYDFTAYKSVGSVGAPRQDAFTAGLVYKFN